MLRSASAQRQFTAGFQLMSSVVGILSEAGRIDEASAIGLEAVPLMRRARMTYLDRWPYLFWRRGQAEVAALLLGAFDARRARTGDRLYPNEKRLTTQAGTGLATVLDPTALARALAAGALLSEGEVME